MNYIAIKYKNEREWEYIKNTLSKYNIFPHLIGSWNTFKYISYDIEENILTNYSNLFFTYCKDVIFCSNATEFIYKIGMLFNMKKEFTIADLKSGMVVKLNNNQYYLVVDNILISTNGQMPLKDYDENMYLTDEYHKSEYSIKEVYQKKYRTWEMGFNDGLENNLVLLWKRKNVEYTMQEIADKLGIPVEQLRIKK